jgi:hypothetical protein
MVKTAALAGILCNTARFRKWLSIATGTDNLNAAEAADVVRQVCKVESRAELNTNRQAERLFHQLLRRPYLDWHEK